MSFELEDNETRYHLTFTEHPGLEVTSREPSVGQLLEMTAAAGVKKDDLGPAAIRSMFRMFAGLLIEWNITRKGEPVPATYEGVETLGAGLVLKIMQAVVEAVSAPDPTSPPASASGEMEAGIPMTPLRGS